jgi:hypothetical protein
MEEQMSRREMFGYSAAAIGGVTALTVGVQAGTDEHQEHSQPEAGSSHPEPNRPYREESYSGGPPHVKPLPP